MDQRRIVGLNNQGVRLLQQRNHRQASQSLLQSLSHLKDAMKKRPLPDKAAEDLVEDVERRNLFCLAPISQEPTSTISLPFQMFNHIFAFSTCSEHNPASLHKKEGSLATILYNLGVTNHAKALDLQQEGRSHKLALAKALQMYTWALSAVQNWARHHIVHEGCHVLRLAILNNMAHVHALLQKPAKAQHCLKCLRDILYHAKGHVAAQEYAFFSANVVVLCLKGDSGSLVKAPAAAA